MTRILLLVFCLLGCWLRFSPARADSSNLNLAYGQPATASSLEKSTLVASNVTDGDHTTRWSSQFADPQWIYIDLGAVQPIDRVRLTWEAAYGKTFTIDVSNDANTWTTVKTVSDNTNPAPTTNNGLRVNEYERLQTSGRYVRMYGTARATGYGYSLYEFEVFSYSNPRVSLATGKVGQASNVQNNFNPGLAFDGDSTTRWSTLNTTNQWVYVDLKGYGTLSRIYINWEAAWGIAYQIQTSNDASTWTTVASISSNQAYYNELSLPSGTRGRYVRMLGQTGGQNNGGFSIWEMRVYGTLTPLPVQLASFTAQRAASAVALDWATASELSNRGFEVQRSADGVEFATLALVAGVGSSASTHRYQYRDAAAPAGFCYYRLRQLDQDGTSTYSPTVAVAGAANATAAPQVYPNPATTQATLSWQASATHTAHWVLRTALGQVVQAGELTGEAGPNAQPLPLAGLAPGPYMLTLDVPDQATQRTRLLVQ